MQKIKQEVIEGLDGQKYFISTVYLGIDHGFGGVPKWYETMVFRCDNEGKVTDWLELDCDRYTTVDEASEGHTEMVGKWSVQAITDEEEN